MRKLVCLVLVLLGISIPVVVHAWGVEGHEVIATLAQSMLSDKAKAGVQSLLGDATLASVANWADQVRYSSRPESYNWHFVDIPLSAPGFLHDRDCFRPDDTKHPGSATDHNNCVVDRITMFKQVLADPTASQPDRVAALKFVVHFVGDVHQPYHAVGDKTGGNDIHVIEFGNPNCGGTAAKPTPCNLHSAWDTGMIVHTGMDVNAYAAHLQEIITTNHLTATGTPEDWANESHAAGGPAWLNDGGAVDDAYYNTNIQVVDKRLALAALRLAAVLEEALNPQSIPPAGPTGVASRNVNLRPDASTSQKAIETIHKGDQVTLLETAQTNGYYHVKAADGKQGWVYAKYVKVQPH